MPVGPRLAVCSAASPPFSPPLDGKTDGKSPCLACVRRTRVWW
jgi:hypothetical protein